MPCVDWAQHIQKRVALDKKRPYQNRGVTSVVADFIEWVPDQQYDIVLCLQVLEHIKDANLFAKKLLDCGSIVIISVPYKWDEGKTKNHIHDPVDRAKLYDGFGREPNFEYIATEVLAPADRIIQVYEPFLEKWTGLNRRAVILKSKL